MLPLRKIHEKKKALSDFRVCQKWEREWKDGASI